jgi:predicted  nucleic acid-binding Zn-ribbon protein
MIFFTSDLDSEGDPGHRNGEMEKEASRAEQKSKLRASRDGWKERAGKKQHEIKRLRVTVRDLTNSREYWKELAKELQQQVNALQLVNGACLADSSSWLFFGG